jgi:hypothetical protein
VKTFAALPRSYEGKLTVTINDHDPHTLARNVIICLLAASDIDGEGVSECIVHLWYSALIRQTDLDLITTHVLPMVQAVCTSIKDKSDGSLHAKTWQLGKCSLRAVLTKGAWQLLLSCLTVRPELTLEKAQALRLAVTDSPRFQDDRDRVAVRQMPQHRVSKHRLNKDGIVLPFGHSREAFVIPNP